MRHAQLRADALQRGASRIYDIAAIVDGAVDGVDDVVEGVVAGNARLERQQAAQEVLVHLPPPPDLHEILGAGQRAAQYEQKDFRKRIQHLPGLARVFERGKVLDQRWARHRETSATRGLP